MEPEESKISVWVCREEKLVFGLSKRTTCADVVKVLLEDQNSQHGLSPACPRSHCIVEKWRGFERILPNKTKILRLWVAWGEEQADVKFALVKSEASSFANHGARSAEARVVLSKHGPCGTAKGPVSGVSPEKQRRVVRKAFRKLEKINGTQKRARAAHRDASSAERMETLAHLVISQDHTIRQQSRRIAELSCEIERCEAKVHLDRIQRHGANYVQDTYLVDAAAASSRQADARCSAETLAKFEEFVRRCEDVVGLEEELWEQEALADIIAVQVQEELNHRWMRRRREELRSGDAEDDGLLLEAERIRTQLDASSYIGLRLNADLEAIRADLELTLEICGAREKEMRDLLEKVDTLDMDEEGGCRHATGDKTGMMSAPESKSAWVEQVRGLSKDHSVNDDDSDTGLSSLHSQDSDSHPVWESLV